jgi:plasmid stabilization system protein ParE
MARVELAPEVLDDFERILDHLLEHGSTDAPQRIARIVEAFDILQAHPLIGRPASSAQRELVIGQGTRGCVARYCFVADIDTVFVLAVRSQREAGFRR